MYEYSQLDNMLLPALQEIAHQLKVAGFRKFKRKELIEEIIAAEKRQSEPAVSNSETNDSQSNIPSSDSENQNESAESLAKKARMRKPVGGSRVFTSLTGEKAGSSDVSSLSGIKKPEENATDKANTTKEEQPKEHQVARHDFKE